MSHPFWAGVFGNLRPVEIELGPGRGEVLLALAAARPDTNFFGIERIAPLADLIRATATARGLSNVRAIAGDARCVVASLLPDASVQAYHIYFPDPWPKNRHRSRRLFYGDLLGTAIARTLRPEGTVHLASDLPPVVEAMVRALVRAGLEPVPPVIPPAWPGSKYERRYAKGRTCRASLVLPAPRRPDPGR